MGDEKIRHETDNWITSITDLLDGDIALPPIDLGLPDRRDFADVDLDRLCESILGNLKALR